MPKTMNEDILESEKTIMKSLNGKSSASRLKES
jgi:hypothetical protein